MAVGYPLLSSNHKGVGQALPYNRELLTLPCRGRLWGIQLQPGQDLGQNNPDRPCGEGLPQRR